MKVLVTGSTGFLGRYTRWELESRGHDVIGFDLEYGNDIRNYDWVEEQVGRADAVIHLAGVLGTHELFEDMDLAVDVNLKGGLNVVRAVHDLHTPTFVTIEQPHIWYNPYEATKGAMTRIARGMFHGYDSLTRLEIVTTYNAYGPGQAHGPSHPQKMVPTFAYNAWRKIGLPIYGDGTQFVDLVYAGDVAIELVNRVEGREDTKDAATGEGFTVNQVASTVARIVADHGGPQVVELTHLPMRKGEQGDHGALCDPATAGYDFNYWQFVETVLSYKE